MSDALCIALTGWCVTGLVYAWRDHAWNRERAALKAEINQLRRAVHWTKYHLRCVHIDAKQAEDQLCDIEL